MQNCLSGPGPSVHLLCCSALGYSTGPRGSVKDRIQVVGWWARAWGGTGVDALPWPASLSLGKRGPKPSNACEPALCTISKRPRGPLAAHGPCFSSTSPGSTISAFAQKPRALSPKMFLLPHPEASAFVGGQVLGSRSLQTLGLPLHHYGVRACALLGARGPVGEQCLSLKDHLCFKIWEFEEEEGVGSSWCESRGSPWVLACQPWGLRAALKTQSADGAAGLPGCPVHVGTLTFYALS